MDEIVNLVTLPKYKNRLIVVLAGYDRDINHLMATNPGFGSRFSEVIEFPNLSPKQCQELLLRLLQDRKLGVGGLCSSSVAATVQASFQALSGLPGWGNARDVENLATSLFGKVISAPVSPPCLDVASRWVYDKMDEMISERAKRAEDAADFQVATTRQSREVAMESLKAMPDRQIRLEKATATKKAASPPEVPQQANPGGEDKVAHGRREPGVSDGVWCRLEERKAKLKDILDTTSKSELEKEEEVQKCLMASGRCVLGYEWLRVEGGFRCAGGSHYMSLNDIWRNYGIAL